MKFQFRSAATRTVSKQLAPVTLYAQFGRINEETREVDGFCYVNATTSSDNWDVPREVLEAATPDYLKFGNIREMHQASAVGVVITLEWQEKGCFINVKVVDEAAWDKVRNKVYKGFSIGWNILAVTGNKVTLLDWIETSLVDRPADPDALISAYRALNLGQAEAEIEEGAADETPTEEVPTRVDTENSEDEAPAEIEAEEVESEQIEPAVDALERVTTPEFARVLSTFRDIVSRRENYELQYLAFYTLQDLLYELSNGEEWSDAAGLTTDERDAAARQAIAEFTEYIVPLVVARSQMQRAADAAQSRAAGIDESEIRTRVAAQTELLTRSNSELSTRIERAESDLSGQRQRVEDLTADLQRARAGLPVRFPAAFERSFAANAESAAPETKTLVERYRHLSETLRDEPDAQKRSDGVTEMGRIKLQLHDLGVSLSG